MTRKYNLSPKLWPTRHPLYETWRSMRQRCRGEKYGKWHGARGITVCPEWEHFWTFVFDMGPKPSATHSIDRKDNDGPYAPWNCRWATGLQQSENSRSIKPITVDGVTKTRAEWARHLNISIVTLWRREKTHGYEVAVRMGAAKRASERDPLWSEKIRAGKKRWDAKKSASQIDWASP